MNIQVEKHVTKERSAKREIPMCDVYYIEATWSYRYKPALKGEIRKRQEGQSPEIQAIAWKAQDRLHRKYYRLMGRGKPSGKVITAIARELAGFVWAIACKAEKAV